VCSCVSVHCTNDEYESRHFASFFRSLPSRILLPWKQRMRKFRYFRAGNRNVTGRGRPRLLVCQIVFIGCKCLWLAHINAKLWLLP
jgi:hypothetical protein